jgi:hypothetical protein
MLSTFNFLICVVHMRKYCSCEKKIDLEILTDLHALSHIECQVVFGMAYVCAPH